MSDPQRYTQLPVCVEPSYQAQEVVSPMAKTVKGGEWVKWEDYARLKAEVERLRASSFVTAVPVEQYERLRKAGDELAWAFSFAVSRHDGEPSGLVKAWNAAKEGKPSV